MVAMKTGIDTLRGLRYKLRMMGVPISGPTYIYRDNVLVVNNATKLESTLKKKSNSICYHAIRESVSMDESRVTHIPTTQNCADLATKIIPGGMKKNALISQVIYDVADVHGTDDPLTEV